MILGLLKELPLDHPMRAKLKRMIGSAEGKFKADSMEKTALMEKRLHFVKPPEDNPVLAKGRQLKPQPLKGWLCQVTEKTICTIIISIKI